MVFTVCKKCGQTLLVAVGIEEWHCLNALCKSNASGMNSSLQRILKNASGMKEPFRPTFKTELEDILDEGDGPDDDDYLEACAQVEGASVKGTMKPDVCKSAVPKKVEKSEQSAGAWNAQEAFQKWKPIQTGSPAKRRKPSGPRSQSSPRGQTWVSGHSRRMSR